MTSCLSYVIEALNRLIRAFIGWPLANNIHFIDLFSYLFYLTIAVYFITHIQFKGGSTGSVHNKTSYAGSSKGAKK